MRYLPFLVMLVVVEVVVDDDDAVLLFVPSFLSLSSSSVSPDLIGLK
jgi:hypothetical protein